MHDTPHPLKAVTGLQELGFEGFCPVKDLRASSGRSPAPATIGVYLVIREQKDRPKFLDPGTGGYFQGQDPNVSIDELANNWVEDALIIYVGSSSNLQRRIKQLILFGSGKDVGHRGGKLMWQIADAEDFKICWKPVADKKQGKKLVLVEFKRAHQGRRPFANLQG